MSNFVVENGEGPPFIGSIFDQNNSKHQARVERQPSYLLAVGVMSQHDAESHRAKEPLVATHSSFAPIPRFEVGRSRQQHVDMQDTDSSSKDFSSQISPFGQQAAGYDSMSFRKSKHSRLQVDGFAVERLPSAANAHGKSFSQVRNVNEQSYVNCNSDRQEFMKMKCDVQPDIISSYGVSAMAAAQKVKQIPRAVIAPMSRTEVVGRPYPVGNFSSLPKTLKNTHLDKGNPLKDSFDIEPSAYTSESCSLKAKQQDLGSGQGDSFVYSKQLSTSEHSGIVSDYVKGLHPSSYSNRQSDEEKPKMIDDIYEGHSYIHPQTVKSVLSYQNLTRKLHGSCCQKDEIAGVTTGKSVPVVAPNNVNRNLACVDTRPVCWSSSEIVSVPFSSEMPLGRMYGGDRRSASSTSTTGSSHLDSGYCGDCRDSASLTSISQSPELCDLGLVSSPINSSPLPRIMDHGSVDTLCQAVNWESDRCFSAVSPANEATNQTGRSHLNCSEVLQTIRSPKSWPQCHENFAEGLSSLPVLTGAHLQRHDEAPSPRWSRMQLNSDVAVSDSRSDYRNIHHLNMMPVGEKKLSGAEMIAVRQRSNLKQTVAGEYAAKPGIENSTEQMKYLSMLQRQIKLYRVKDEENMRLEDGSGQKFAVHNDALLRTVCIPDTQADRNVAQSSCFDLENVAQDSAFKSIVSKQGASKICGSIDLSTCKPHQLEMGGNVHNLISKTKALERKRVGLGAVESNHDDLGASYSRPEPGIYHNFADGYPTLNYFQRMHKGETKRKAESNCVCRSSKVTGTHGENPEQLARSMKSDADMTLANSMLANSAEDIINTWMLLKNERNIRVQKNDNSLIPVTSTSVKNFTTSSVLDMPAGAKTFHVSSHHAAPTLDDNCQRKTGKLVKKSVSFSDNVALIASTEEVPNRTVDYVEYVTSFLRKRTSGLKSVEVTDDRSSQCESSGRGSLSSEPKLNSSGSRSNSDISVPESSANSSGWDSDFYEKGESECSEGDSEGTVVDEAGRIRCSLCRKRWIDISDIYCKDCGFYMAKFQQAAL